MGIATRVVKGIVRDHTVAWTNAQDEVVATSDSHPEVAVVYKNIDPPLVMTVLWRTQERYVRPDTIESTTKGQRA